MPIKTFVSYESCFLEQSTASRPYFTTRSYLLWPFFPYHQSWQIVSIDFFPIEEILKNFLIPKWDNMRYFPDVWKKAFPSSSSHYSSIYTTSDFDQILTIRFKSKSLITVVLYTVLDGLQLKTTFRNIDPDKRESWEWEKGILANFHFHFLLEMATSTHSLMV